MDGSPSRELNPSLSDVDVSVDAAWSARGGSTVVQMAQSIQRPTTTGAINGRALPSATIDSHTSVCRSHGYERQHNVIDMAHPGLSGVEAISTEESHKTTELLHRHKPTKPIPSRPVAGFHSTVFSRQTDMLVTRSNPAGNGEKKKFANRQKANIVTGVSQDLLSVKGLYTRSLSFGNGDQREAHRASAVMGGLIHVQHLSTPGGTRVKKSQGRVLEGGVSPRPSTSHYNSNWDSRGAVNWHGCRLDFDVVMHRDAMARQARQSSRAGGHRFQEIRVS